jgi:hypothetical protein
MSGDPDLSALVEASITRVLVNPSEQSWGFEVTDGSRVVVSGSDGSVRCLASQHSSKSVSGEVSSVSSRTHLHGQLQSANNASDRKTIETIEGQHQRLNMNTLLEGKRLTPDIFLVAKVDKTAKSSFPAGGLFGSRRRAMNTSAPSDTRLGEPSSFLSFDGNTSFVETRSRRMRPGSKLVRALAECPSVNWDAITAPSATGTTRRRPANPLMSRMDSKTSTPDITIAHQPRGKTYSLKQRMSLSFDRLLGAIEKGSVISNPLHRKKQNVILSSPPPDSFSDDLVHAERAQRIIVARSVRAANPVQGGYAPRLTKANLINRSHSTIPVELS